MCVIFVILSVFKNIILYGGMNMGNLKLTTNNDYQTIAEAFEEFQQFNKMKDLSDYTTQYYEGVYRVFTKHYERRKFVH